MLTIEQVSKFFHMGEIYLYSEAVVHSQWQIIPILDPRKHYKVGLLNPDGEWQELTYLSDSYTSVEGAIAVGKAYIDLRMTELEAES